MAMRWDVRVIVFIALAGPYLVAGTASAQEQILSVEQLEDLSLEELVEVQVVTASLRPQEVREVPATTYVVTEQDFRMYGYRDLKDILRNLPGIEYIDPHSHLFGGQRGFSSFWEMTKLLVDGRETNLLSTGAMFVINQFPLTGVKRVEIVQGPTSVLYGPEALSGVINIITKDAENSPQQSELTGFVGGGDKSSQDTSSAFHSVARRGDWGLAVGGYVDGGRGPNFTDFLKTSDYDPVDRDRRTYYLDHGNPYRNDDRNLKFNADVTFTPSSRIRLQAGVLYLRGESGIGLEQSLPTYTNTDTITEQTHFYANSEYRSATLPVKATLSYHLLIDNFWARTQGLDDSGDLPPLLVAYNWENSKLHIANLQIDVFPSSVDNYFLAGVGIRDTRLGEPAFTGSGLTDTSPGQPVSLVGRYLFPPTGYFSTMRPYLDQNRIYVYAQDQQGLASKKVQLTAGIRYDHHSVYGDVVDVRSGVLIRPLANYTLKAIFGQGFREPTVFELSGNPKLSPVRMNSGEVSLLFAPLRQLSGQIAYYQNRASKLIVFDAGPTSSGFFSLSNSGEKSIGGIESLVRYQVGPVGGDVWHAYEYAIDGKPMLSVAKNKVGFGGHYDYRGHLSLALRAKYTSSADGQSVDAQQTPIDITVPQYFTLDLNALARELEYSGVRWDISFSIFNVLGRRNYYANQLVGRPSRFLAEGREFFGRVTVRY
jgi:outer membrane receptor for ferrienterochelin and colicins